MNAFVLVFSAFLAASSALPVDQSVALTQDTLGNYNLRLLTNDVTRSEEGFRDGKVSGSYSFVHPDGFQHIIRYISDPVHGYIAEGSVPVPVQDTPEVAAAKAEHLAIVAKERALLPPLIEEQYRELVPVAAPVHFQTLPSLPLHTAPVRIYVDNTAELEAAKAEHFAAHQAALAALAAEYRKIA